MAKWLSFTNGLDVPSDPSSPPPAEAAEPSDVTPSSPRETEFELRIAVVDADCARMVAEDKLEHLRADLSAARSELELANGILVDNVHSLAAARSLAEDLGHNAESWQNAYQRSVVFRDEALALADERDRELDLVRSFLRYITTHNDYARFRFPEMDEYLAALAPSTETRQDEMDRLAGKGAREVAEFRSQHIGDPFAPGHICFKCAAPSTDATPEG